MKKYLISLFFLHSKLSAMCCCLISDLYGMQSAVPKVLPIQKQDAVLVYMQHKRAVAIEQINQHIIKKGLQSRREFLYQALDDQIRHLLLPEHCDAMYRRSFLDQSINAEKQMLKQARLHREEEKISEGEVIAKMWKDYQPIFDAEWRTSLQKKKSAEL